MTGATDTASQTRLGGLYALAAYGAWGLFPLFWKQLGAVPAVEILAHRVVWSLAFVLVLLVAARQGREAWLVLRRGRNVLSLSATTILVAGNWGIFIWAVNNDHALEASLGYYINPLVNVALGVLFLGERLRPVQTAAIALAVVGVLILALAGGTVPWVALSLALTFGFYGLLRKTMPVTAIVGLAVETGLITPFALAYLVWLAMTGEGAFLGDGRISALLALGGVVTALPLLWFAAAARRLRYSTLGLFQYLAPSVQFLIAVLVFKEPLTTAHLMTFACIWTAVALYTLDARRAVARA